MDFTKKCAKCGILKPFSYYQPVDPNIRTTNKGSKPMNRKFNPEDLHDVCVTCIEPRNQRFERAADHIQDDYIFELSASNSEFSEADKEWWTLPEEEAHQFSYPPRKQWFKCKGCSEVFPKAAKFRGKYKYCEPCGLDYNKKQRLISYYKKKKLAQGGTEETISHDVEAD